MTKIKKNDFIEIEFTGLANGEIFDTTNKKDAEKMGIEPTNIKPLTISVGNQMILQGLDEDLEGKETGKEYSIHILPEKAFGKRDPSMIKTYGLSHFTKQNINPYPGMALQLDNTIAKVLSVSGGRVTMDFNNPIAGKEVDYKYKINKIITENKEKINALQDFFFKQRFEFQLKDKKVIFKDDKIKQFIDMIGPKFSEITGLEFTAEAKKETKKESKKEEKK
ncbi:MAG TPA: peptidylprolyl isomerase [Candidatus Pacearchaeota archaeon]|jgi:FKBP-type peptidyl-prolyl cis-trans isomerase 2|nr:peptidylprolyl isomerase [Candidatus Pacearchaeota archaeon]